MVWILLFRFCVRRLVVWCLVWFCGLNLISAWLLMLCSCVSVLIVVVVCMIGRVMWCRCWVIRLLVILCLLLLVIWVSRCCRL